MLPLRGMRVPVLASGWVQRGCAWSCPACLLGERRGHELGQGAAIIGAKVGSDGQSINVARGIPAGTKRTRKGGGQGLHQLPLQLSVPGLPPDPSLLPLQGPETLEPRAPRRYSSPHSIRYDPGDALWGLR